MLSREFILRKLGQTPPNLGRGVSLYVDAAPAGRPSGDAVVRVRFAEQEFAFIVEVTTRASPQMLMIAMQQARASAQTTGLLPLVVAPYLSERALNTLEEQQVAGLDACGNALIAVAGKLLLRRSGQPNLFPTTTPTKFAFRGTTSLVARTFFRRSEFVDLKDLQQEMSRAGQAVALSTISKAIARMQDDVLVAKDKGGISLLQPDLLLDALARQFETPRVSARSVGSLTAPLQVFFAACDAVSPCSVVLSGASSGAALIAGMRTDATTIYCKNIAAVLASTAQMWKVQERFANCVLIETNDPTLFFSSTISTDGIRRSSLVQSYLEFATSRDKRDQEAAEEIRRLILNAQRKQS